MPFLNEPQPNNIFQPASRNRFHPTNNSIHTRDVLSSFNAGCQRPHVTRRMIAGKILPWRRFWTPLAGRLSAGHDGRGFIDDPEDDFGHALNPAVFSLAELLARPCLVLSGQPGIGKTQRSLRLSSQPCVAEYGSFFQASNIATRMTPKATSPPGT